MTKSKTTLGDYDIRAKEAARREHLDAILTKTNRRALLAELARRAKFADEPTDAERFEADRAYVEDSP